MIRSFALSAAVLAFLAGHALAQGPLTTAFTYQGELRQSGNLATGLFDLRFRLYSAPTGGSQLGSTLCADNVQLSAGRFTIDLDFGAQFSGQQQYLEIDVRPDTGLDCSNTTGYTTLAPRQPITAAPNSLFALNAGTAATATSSSNATQLNGQSASFYQNAANLSSGTIPSARLSGAYTSTLTLSNTSNVIAGTFSGSGANLTALNASSITSGTLDPARLPAVLSLLSNNPSPTLRAETTSTDQNASGVFGIASDPTGTGAGVIGETNSPSGLGGYFQGPNVALQASSTADDAVRAYTPGVGKSAVAGFSTAFNGGYGIYGQNNGNAGAGIYGRAVRAGTTVPGILGESSSINGKGIQGNATASSGSNYGGYFTATSPDGTALAAFHNSTAGLAPAVYGATNSTDNAVGVLGEYMTTNGAGLQGAAVRGKNHGIIHGGMGVWGTQDNYGWGVLGESQGGYGVHGRITNGAIPDAYGVLGSCGSLGYAVYADGRFAASGTKAFRIDHPADPENKYLMHYCEEGPEPLNIYRGAVTLDANGSATVTLPDYFSRINKNPTYTLTPVGAPMPMLYIAQPISDDDLTAGAAAEPNQPAPTVRFIIAGGAAGKQVSWRVEATRNDRWVRQYGAPIEAAKNGYERGRYQNPELFGKPESARFIPATDDTSGPAAAGSSPESHP